MYHLDHDQLLMSIQGAISGRSLASNWCDYKNCILHIIYGLQALGELPKESVYLTGTLRSVQDLSGPSTRVVQYELHAEHASLIGDVLVQLELNEFIPPARQEMLIGDTGCIRGKSKLLRGKSKLPSYHVGAAFHMNSDASLFENSYRDIVAQLIAVPTVAEFLHIWNENIGFWKQFYCRSTLPYSPEIPDIVLSPSMCDIRDSRGLLLDASTLHPNQLPLLEDSGIFVNCLSMPNNYWIIQPDIFYQSELKRNYDIHLAIWDTLANTEWKPWERDRLRVEYLEREWIRNESIAVPTALELPDL